jgi:hypothetical protein
MSRRTSEQWLALFDQLENLITGLVLIPGKGQLQN